MEDDIYSILRSNKLFSSLDESTLTKLIVKFQLMDLPQGNVLFHQGDVSDYFYLVIKGRLSATILDANGNIKKVGYIEAGESVGEAGALGNEPRTATIAAVRPSTLLKLPSKDLIELCHQFPSVMFAVIHPVIVRSQKVMDMLSAEKSRKHITLVPANASVAPEYFFTKLTEHAGSFSNIIILSDFDPELAALPADALQEKVQTIIKNKTPNRKILYLLKSHSSYLAKWCFRKTDMVYLVCDASKTPTVDKQLLEKIENRGSHLKSSPELILLHPKETSAPRKTMRWLQLGPFSFAHHLRYHSCIDLHRLVRFIRGKATGVVLGGGGTRGWAHFGVIKALKEAKIPIDAIGGTSVGAIIAACYAIKLSYEEAYERFYEIVRSSLHSTSIRSFTWPAVSIFDAKRFTLSLQSAFEGFQLEDLWIPYFCNSCNLANNFEEVHRSGVLWEKTRASSSLPGLIPPMVINGQLHYDGGLINNLPVDIMRDLVGPKGKIIAAELGNTRVDETYYQFPPILPFWQALIAKLGLGFKDYKFPPFMDSFLRAVFAGSLLKTRQNSMAANVLISMDASAFSMLHGDLKQADDLVALGYEEAVKQLGQREEAQT